jgi:uncharacterized membrane protein YsdA (DUF1294 family)/cold shock CspA family protein
MASRSPRREGIIASWNGDRGFGFIQPKAGGPQVFMHIRALPRGSSAPRPGEALSYELETTDTGKTRARYVRLAGAPQLQKYGRTRSSVLSYLPVVAFAVVYFVVAILWTVPYWVGVVYVGASILCFLIYAIDKSAAAEGGWRVSESALLLLGLAGGWPGAIVAQQVLHHKTGKRSFQAAFAGSVVLNVVLFVFLTSPLYAKIVQAITSQ